MSVSLSGVGVLDKVAAVLDAVLTGPQTLTGLMESTGQPRATAHRLASAMELHGLLGRDHAGRWVLGSRFSPDGAGSLVAAAQPVLDRTRDLTGESVQLFVRRGGERVCVAASDRRAGLRDTVPVGARLPLTAGSGAKVLLAWAAPEDVGGLLRGATFGTAELAGVRRRGLATSVGEREPGVASVSAPVWRGDTVTAALCVSGPVDRLGRQPARRVGAAAVAAAAELTRLLAQ
jgi:DNA-binding IclR family transcriptional regulator